MLSLKFDNNDKNVVMKSSLRRDRNTIVKITTLFAIRPALTSLQQLHKFT